MSDPPLKPWMSAAEIAALKLAGLSATESGIIQRAKREAWRGSGLARQREGRGGGWEYHYTVLPRAAGADFERRIKASAAEGDGTAIALAAERRAAVEPRSAGSLTARQRQVMEARAALLTEVNRIILMELQSPSSAVDRLLDTLAREGEDSFLTRAAKTASERGTVSRPSLLRWWKAREERGLIGLAPQAKGEAAPLPLWFDTWLHFYAQPAKPTIAGALDEYAKSLPNKADAPNYDQVRRALAKLGPLEREQGREGKLAMRKRLAYVSRDTSDLLPSTIYVADGKTFDAEIAHPIHGRPFRPEITSIIDVATRVCVGWSVDLDENAFGVVDALRRACMEWGIPAIWYTDRGPGYVAKVMTDPLIGFLGRAGITPMKALPYNSQAKGIVERLNQIYTPFSKTFPTFIGKDMDGQAKKLAYKVTRGELREHGTSRLLPDWQAFRDGLVATIAAYNDRPHSELPKIVADGRRRHMTPREAWEAKCRDGFEPIVPSAAEMDEMFRPHMVRVTRRGLVELFTNSYFLPALEAFDGERVAVGYDIADGSKVWVHRLNRTDNGYEPGTLIGVAIFGGNKTRYVPLTAERDALERRARGRLRRNDDRRKTIEGELSPLLEYQPLAPLPIIEAEPLPIAANDAAKPVRLGYKGRPIFHSTLDYVAWLSANPDKLEAHDAANLRDELKWENFRELCRMRGLDVEALRVLAKSIA